MSTGPGPHEAYRNMGLSSGRSPAPASDVLSKSDVACVLSSLVGDEGFEMAIGLLSHSRPSQPRPCSSPVSPAGSGMKPPAAERRPGGSRPHPCPTKTHPFPVPADPAGAATMPRMTGREYLSRKFHPMDLEGWLRSSPPPAGEQRRAATSQGIRCRLPIEKAQGYGRRPARGLWAGGPGRTTGRARGPSNACR
jgi:hypothetical protein